MFGRDRRAWGRDVYVRIGVRFELPASYDRQTARENLEHFSGLHDSVPRDIDELLAATVSPMPRNNSWQLSLRACGSASVVT